MLHRFRSRLTYANVMVTILAFIVFGGGAYAAFHLPKNSVRSKNIVYHQVKPVDVAKEAALKSAGLANDNNANCASTPNQWASVQPNIFFGPVGYQRDQLGYVHLNGVAEVCGSPSSGAVIFKLPRGYRPSRLVEDVVGRDNNVDFGTVRVNNSGEVAAALFSDGDKFALQGVTFRCAPSGKNGCP